MTNNPDPDLFSTGRQSSGKRAQVSKPTTPTHILPKNLENALAKLPDGDFDRLLDGVLREQKRRARLKPVSSPTPRDFRSEAHSLTTGQINAIRAAIRAGVKPTQIARQFRVSQSDIKTALRTDRETNSR
jgi:hypothetical protein